MRFRRNSGCIEKGADSAGATSSATSNAVPLSAFSHFEKTTEPLAITHQGQFPAITVSFNLAPNAALGERHCRGQQSAERHAHAAQPAGRFSRHRGIVHAIRWPMSRCSFLPRWSLCTSCSASCMRALSIPITILSTLPSAGVGAFLALILFHQDLSVVAIIGIVLLIGIVKKNGIMMVDFALEGERKHGKNATDAIYEACLLRFRPIMMTTMAALLGGLPLALGTGFGSELRRPLGIAMVGGLLLSQVLTLYTTPVIYIFFDNLAQRFAQQIEAAGSRRRGTGRAGMNISAPFIRRPVATTLLTVAIALAGAIAFEVLPVSPLPEVDFPTISVSARLAGRQRRHYGVVRRHSPGAAVRSYRRSDGDDLRQLARQHLDHHSVRPQPRH